MKIKHWILLEQDINYPNLNSETKPATAAMPPLSSRLLIRFYNVVRPFSK